MFGSQSVRNSGDVPGARWTLARAHFNVEAALQFGHPLLRSKNGLLMKALAAQGITDQG